MPVALLPLYARKMQGLDRWMASGAGRRRQRRVRRPGGDEKTIARRRPQVDRPTDRQHARLAPNHTLPLPYHPLAQLSDHDHGTQCVFWSSLSTAAARSAVRGELGTVLTDLLAPLRPSRTLPTPPSRRLPPEAAPPTPSRSSRRLSVAATAPPPSASKPKAKAAPTPKKAKTSAKGSSAAAAAAPSDEILEVEMGEPSSAAVSAKDAVNGLAEAAGLKRKRPVGRPRQSVAKAQKPGVNSIPKPTGACLLLSPP